MLTVALPNKGRMAGQTRELFADAGLPVRLASDRSLHAALGTRFKAIFVRSKDIPRLVAEGVADAGVTGWDLVRESGRDLRKLADLRVGCCRLVVAVPDQRVGLDQHWVPRLADVGATPRIATSFPRLTREFFADMDMDITVVPVSGAAEVAPGLGLSDAVVDLTQSGATLAVNGLTEVATVLESSACLVANDDVDDDGLVELTFALRSVVEARGQRYLMANVPVDVLDEVSACLPGLGGPTVARVRGSDGVAAVQAIVPEEDVYQVVMRLKALGCKGILVTRVERLVP